MSFCDIQQQAASQEVIKKSDYEISTFDNTVTSHTYLSTGSCGSQAMKISQQMRKTFVLDIGLKSTNSRLQPQLSGINELTPVLEVDWRMSPIN